ncbi:BREX system ATP-binding domain-containing protein [Cohnella suwonensis]|uniref:BREX system ATP-binding domain-containing protein n=1 Tax=Cohnella suwonensis TaxID=696072 RepID=A0ABW0M332_9BACL
MSDLRRCVISLEEAGEIVSFELARMDEVSRFRLPRTLFGRESEEEELRNAFERVRAGETEFVFVTGREGSGKTALVRELQTAVARAGGRFIAGKCDLMNRDIPFEPILQAFRSLIQYIWSETPDNVARLRAGLSKSLGTGAGVVAELLPEAAKLLGDNSSAEPLPPSEAAIRFRRLLSAFLKAFADKDRPVVMFLDDLQWADPATRDLLRAVAHDLSLRGLLVIGAFRSESAPGTESGDDHDAAARWIEHTLSLENTEAQRVRHIALEPLSYVDVRRFVSGVLNENTARVRGLAESLYHRTGGNPLVLHRLLDSLHRDNKLYFDEEQALWTWDAAAIRRIPVNPDVLPLIESRLRLLPRETVGLLALAAALGQRFRPDLLARIDGRTLSDTLGLLRIAEDEGLIGRETDAAEGEEGDVSYAFLHDRVQQAAYDTVPDSDKAGLHLKIGRAMRRDGPERTSDSIFDTVHHLNLGCSEMTDEAERRKLAAFNYQAGLKSKATTAFAAGQRYLETGLRLLGEEEAVPGSLAYRLMLELPECEYMCGRVSQADDRLEQLMGRTTDLVERSRIYLIRIKMNAYLRRDEEAANVGLQALAEFGWELPAAPSNAAMAREMALTQWALFRMGNRLPKLPHNDHPRYRALSDLVMAMSASAFVLDTNLPAVLYPKFIRYGLKQGNNEAFAFMLGAYGMMLRFGFPRLRSGFRIIETARLLSSSFESAVMKCRLHFVIGLSEQSRSSAKAAAHFEQSVRYGLDSADLTFAGFSMALRVINHTGDLRTLSAQIAEYEQSSRSLLDDITRRALRVARWHVEALRGEDGEIDPELKEVMDNRSTKTDDNQSHYICSCIMESSYLAGRYREALEWVERAEGYDAGETPLLTWKRHLYHALSLAALYAEAPLGERKGIRARLRQLLRAPKSFSLGGNAYASAEGSAYLLVKAEWQRIDGKREAAARSFEEAIASARAEGSSLLAAIACERASIFYREAGIAKAAEAMLADSVAAYSEWGAAGKAKKLSAMFPELHLSAYSLPADIETVAEQSGGRTSLGDAREDGRDEPPRYSIPVIGDEKAVLQQLAGWSGITDHHTLTSRFLASALRYSGAEKGYVLNREGEDFVIEAQEGGIIGEAQDDAQFAAAIVRSVVMSGEPVVLADASSSPYAADPYIRRRSRSVLCMPVFFPGNELPAVLYLENSLISGVFTKERLDMLELMITRMVYLKSLKDSRANPYRSDDSAPRSAAVLTKASEPLIEPLTNREAEILYALSDGLSNKEIADRFRIAEATVKTHVSRLYGKLGVKRRGQAIARAREMNIID